MGKEQGCAAIQRAIIRRILLSVALVTAALVIPPMRHASAITTPLPGPVAGWGTTTGTDGRVYIADEQGRARQLHGFNAKTHDPATGASAALLEAAAERGLDHMRLSIFWELLEPAEGAFDEAYLDSVVAALDRAEAEGLLVVLDMHQDVYGSAFGGFGIPPWATRDDGLPYEQQDVWFLNYLQPAVQAAWEHLYEDADLRAWQIRAWLHVVERVQDHPALLGYDLLNEPFGKIRDGESLFEAAERVEREQMTAMYQRLTDAITAVDPDHWIFFEPPNLASLGIPTSLGRVTGPKVALYPHMYDSAIETATYTPGGVVQYDPAFFTRWEEATLVYPEQFPLPVLVGEWGVAHPERPGMDRFVADSLRTMDRSTSGWSVFNWCMGDGYCPLDAAGNDRPGIAQIFQPYARAIAGAPTSSVWDGAARTLRVRYSDSAATGPTEVFIPESRSYPEGWNVTTSAADGTWSHTFDPDTGVLAVTMPETGGAHAICVQPGDEPVECPATDPPPVPSPEPPVPETPVAQPVARAARFTG